MGTLADQIDSIPITLQYIATGTQLQDAQGVLSTYTTSQLNGAKVVAEQEQINLHRARQRLLHTQNSLRKDRELLNLIKWSIALVVVLSCILILYLTAQVTPSAATLASSLLVLLYLIYFVWWAVHRLSQPDAFLHGLSGDATSATKRSTSNSTCG
jgi:ABC-type multidrug transport system fused ATPase/permease subunit